MKITLHKSLQCRVQFAKSRGSNTGRITQSRLAAFELPNLTAWHCLRGRLPRLCPVTPTPLFNTTAHCTNPFCIYLRYNYCGGFLTALDFYQRFNTCTQNLLNHTALLVELVSFNYI